MAKTARGTALDSVEIRREAWSVLLEQTLVGRVIWWNGKDKGDLVLDSAIQLLNPLENDSFTEIYGNRVTLECKGEDLVAFRLKNVPKNWSRDGSKRPPVLKSSSVRLIDKEEFDRIAAEVGQLIQPYLEARPIGSKISEISSLLTDLEKTYSSRGSELKALEDQIAQADLLKLKVETEARESAELRRQAIIDGAYEEVAVIKSLAEEEMEILKRLGEAEMRQTILASAELEQQKELFRTSGGERFVVALGYDYRRMERKMEIVEKPENLVGALSKEMARIGIDIDIPTLQRMVVAHALAAITGQIILYVGPPGSGKSTSGVLIPTLLGMKSSVIPVRPGWLDATDLLGYFDPRHGRFVSAPFVDLVVDAKVDKEVGRFHTVVFDEMNLARIENYGADLISQLEKSHELGKAGLLRLYSPSVQREIDAQKIKAGEEGSPFTEIPAELTIPDNLIIAGTINNDDSTEALSQKVIDRCVTVRVPRVSPKPRFEQSLLPATIFSMTVGLIADASIRGVNDEEEINSFWGQVIQLLSSHKVPGLEDALSQRFAKVVVFAPAVSRALGLDLKVVVDDILSLKILSWIRYFRSQERGGDELLSELAIDAKNLGFTGFAGEIESILASTDDLVHYIR